MESSERNKALVDPIKLREIRTWTDALCLHDVHAFLVQCPNDSRVKRNFDRLVSNNQDDFPLTLQTLQDDTTTFEPTAGHPRRTKLNAIRTPTRLVEVIREYLQHFKKKSSKPNHNTPSYDSTKVQARLLANQSLWWCTDVNVGGNESLLHWLRSQHWRSRHWRWWSHSQPLFLSKSKWTTERLSWYVHWSVTYGKDYHVWHMAKIITYAIWQG